MEKERDLLNKEFELLKNSQRKLHDQIENESSEHRNLEEKVGYLERNLN